MLRRLLIGIIILGATQVSAKNGSGVNGGHPFGSIAVQTMRNFIDALDSIDLSGLTDNQREALELARTRIDGEHQVLIVKKSDQPTGPTVRWFENDWGTATITLYLDDVAVETADFDLIPKKHFVRVISHEYIDPSEDYHLSVPLIQMLEEARFNLADFVPTEDLPNSLILVARQSFPRGQGYGTKSQAKRACQAMKSQHPRMFVGFDCHYVTSIEYQTYDTTREYVRHVALGMVSENRVYPKRKVLWGASSRDRGSSSISQPVIRKEYEPKTVVETVPRVTWDMVTLYATHRLLKREDSIVVADSRELPTGGLYYDNEAKAKGRCMRLKATTGNKAYDRCEVHEENGRYYFQILNRDPRMSPMVME